MPHSPGPYVKHPRYTAGFTIKTADNVALAEVPARGRCVLPRETIAANANLFTAAPAMLLALQAVILDTSIDVTVRDLAQHAINMAVKGST